MNRWIEARHVMTRDLITSKESETLASVREKILEHNIQHIPVVDGKKIIGMISKGDLLKMEHHLSLFEARKAIESNKIIFNSMLASDVMTRKLVMVRETDSLMSVVDIFRENLFHALPVLNEQHELSGIITPLDILVYAFSDERVISV